MEKFALPSLGKGCSWSPVGAMGDARDALPIPVPIPLSQRPVAEDNGGVRTSGQAAAGAQSPGRALGDNLPGWDLQGASPSPRTPATRSALATDSGTRPAPSPAAVEGGGPRRLTFIQPENVAGWKEIREPYRQRNPIIGHEICMRRNRAGSAPPAEHPHPRGGQGDGHKPIGCGRGQNEPPPRAAGEQPPADTPCCGADGAGRSRVCRNTLPGMSNSGNKSEPRCLCARHVRRPLHLFPRVPPPSSPLNPHVDLIFGLVWGCFPTSSGGKNSRLINFHSRQLLPPSSRCVLLLSGGQKRSRRAAKPGENCPLGGKPSGRVGMPQSGP